MKIAIICYISSLLGYFTTYYLLRKKLIDKYNNINAEYDNRMDAIIRRLKDEIK